jgi:hypothetical protein
VGTSGRCAVVGVAGDVRTTDPHGPSHGAVRPRSPRDVVSGRCHLAQSRGSTPKHRSLTVAAPCGEHPNGAMLKQEPMYSGTFIRVHKLQILLAAHGAETAINAC